MFFWNYDFIISLKMLMIEELRIHFQEDDTDCEPEQCVPNLSDFESSSNSDDESDDDDDDYIRLSEMDENDLLQIIEKCVPMAHDIPTFMADQIQNGKKGDPRKRRWHKCVITWALALNARFVFLF